MTKHPYKTRTGATQFKPSIKSLTRAVESGEYEGFCLACAQWTGGVEPDARRYACPSCAQPKVYGAEELLLMGLYYEKAVTQ